MLKSHLTLPFHFLKMNFSKVFIHMINTWIRLFFNLCSTFWILLPLFVIPHKSNPLSIRWPAMDIDCALITIEDRCLIFYSFCLYIQKSKFHILAKWMRTFLILLIWNDCCGFFIRWRVMKPIVQFIKSKLFLLTTFSFHSISLHPTFPVWVEIDPLDIIGVFRSIVQTNQWV